MRVGETDSFDRSRERKGRDKEIRREKERGGGGHIEKERWGDREIGRP